MRKKIVAVVIATVLGLAPCSVSASLEYETQNATQEVVIETGIESETEAETQIGSESMQEFFLEESAKEVQEETEAQTQETVQQSEETAQEEKESEIQGQEETKAFETETEQTTEESTEVIEKQVTADEENKLPFQAILPEGDTPYFGGDENQISLYAQGEQQISQTKLIQSLLSKVGKGYSQSMRYDKDYYDCSSLILRCLQEFGLTGIPFSTYDWNNKLKNMNVGDVITFHGGGHYVSYQLAAVNTNVFSNPNVFLVPGTIMVLIEQGYSGGHVAVSLGSFLRQDNGLNPAKDTVAIVNQTREYVASQLVNRYGADYSLLMGTNPITGYLNTWMDSDWLGTDMLTGDKYSGAYNGIWRVEAFNPSTGVCVTNVPRGTNGLTARYVLVPVDTDSKLEEKLSIDDVKITNVSPKGYQVEAILSANCGISNVLMPTWTEANGQDDLIWHTAKVSGNTTTFYVKASDHKEEGGTYITHIYLYGQNQTYCVKEARVTLPEREIKNYTGFHKDDATGAFYYYKNGKLICEYTGLVFDNEIWYYIKEGKFEPGYTGLVFHYGDWYYVENGILNWNYTGLVRYNGRWYCVQNGYLDWRYSGLVEYYGTTYYVYKGELNWGYYGLVYDNGIWQFVRSGKLDLSYTGLVKHSGEWYYVSQGSVDWTYTGPVEYYGTWYHIRNGYLDWTYSGSTRLDGTVYPVKNGIVQKNEP